MRRKLLFLALVVVFCFSTINIATAASSVGNDLSKVLDKVRHLADSATEKYADEQSVEKEIAGLLQAIENISAINLIVQYQLSSQELLLDELSSNLIKRHNSQARNYEKVINALLSHLQLLNTSETIPRDYFLKLSELFKSTPARKRRPIYGSLPYRHVSFPAQQISDAAGIVPAYHSGVDDAKSADLESAEETAVTVEIASLAESLEWNPVRIYQWVKNNIETEWYLGIMKGAAGTLQQKSGNDADQAALLVALYRASGFPARFITGTIEFYPDITKIQNLTGLDDPLRIAAFFQKAGIAYKPVIAGGQISNFQIEHVWVEVNVPYSNYRGAILDSHGKVWVGLDTSIKPAGTVWENVNFLPDEISVSTSRDAYLAELNPNTPLDFLRSKVDDFLIDQQSELRYDSYLRTQAPVDDQLQVLPASLQFKEINITGEYTSLPNTLLQTVSFSAKTVSGQNLFDLTVPVYQVANKSISLTYEPETINDQELIDSYGGLDGVPAYLVYLRPVLSVNRERQAVAVEGMPLGETYELSVTFASTAGSAGHTQMHQVGNEAVLGIAAQQSILPESKPIEEKTAEDFQHEAALQYLDEISKAEKELASLLQLAISKPLPSLVTVGTVAEIDWLLGVPNTVTWKGLFMDAGFNCVEVTAKAGADQSEVEFMRLAALSGSVQENKVFENLFAVESISTAKLLQQAAANNINLVTVTSSNIDSLLLSLPFDQYIKDDIQNAVAQGDVVRVPVTEIDYLFWRGIGYIKENPLTGESGYMLTGQIAGGMTAGEWPDSLLSTILKSKFNLQQTAENAAIADIRIVTGSNYQLGIVGQPLANNLQVRVTNAKGWPIAKAEVTFSVASGGGHFYGAQTITVLTGGNGVASVKATLGQHTTVNSVYLKSDDGKNLDQAGINYFEARVTGKTGVMSLRNPFVAYAKPDIADHIVKIAGDKHKGTVNTLTGTLSAKVVDQYKNPVSNIELKFKVLPAELFEPEPDQTLHPEHRNLKLYIQDSCKIEYPIYGECDSSDSVDVITDPFGAKVLGFYGDTGLTLYTVELSAADVPSETIELLSVGGVPDDSYIGPRLFLDVYSRVNDNSETIIAVKPDETLQTPIEAFLLLLKNDYKLKGDTLVGSPLMKTTRVKDGTVKFEVVKGGGTVLPTKNNNDGSYETKFRAGSKAELNQIEISAEAKLTIPIVYHGWHGPSVDDEGYPNPIPTKEVSLKVGEVGLFSPEDDELSHYWEESKRTTDVYSVDVTTKINPAIVTVDERYAPTETVNVNYHILPDGADEAGYGADYVYIDVFTADQQGNKNWITTLSPSTTRGQGVTPFPPGAPFKPGMDYYVQTVLNKGSDNEIIGEFVPLNTAKLSDVATYSRTYFPAQYDYDEGTSIVRGFVDGYNVFAFTLISPTTVGLTLIDGKSHEVTALIDPQKLNAGIYMFVVDYKQLADVKSSYFYLQLNQQSAAGSKHNSFYPGTLNKKTNTAKMLGQVMVHDVLIQDGSLNLQRQDFAFKGRGPQIDFSRSYNNQSSEDRHKPLGKGWSHSLDHRLTLLSTSSNLKPVPDWVVRLRGSFFASGDIPETAKSYSIVQVNGAVFKKFFNVWRIEKSKHGTLDETAISFVFTAKDGTRYIYDKGGTTGQLMVARIEDRNGNALLYEYDDKNRISKVTDAVGRYCDFAYTNVYMAFDMDNSRLTDVACKAGISLRFSYNNQGYLVSAERGDRTETYTYALEFGSKYEFNLSKATDANGQSYEYEYYGFGEVESNLANSIKEIKSEDAIKQVVYPDGKHAEFLYKVMTANTRIVKDLRGNDTTYLLNFYGNPNEIHKSVTDEPVNITKMTWSIDEELHDNVMTSRTDANDFTTTYEYDPKGNITKETDPYGNSVQTIWNLKFSLPERREDRNGVIQTWLYDSSGNLEEQVDGDGNSSTYTYYPTGEVRTSTDPRLNTTAFIYDEFGNSDTVTGAEGSVTDLDYDMRGRKLAATDPNGNRTEYTYDELDYPTSVIFPKLTSYALPTGSTKTKTTLYDTVGNLLRGTDRTGLTLEYTYTPRNQVETVIRRDDTIQRGQKRFEYDENGNLTLETDWKGGPTTHHYDYLNRRDSTTNRLGAKMLMAYDLAGNLVKTTDFEGRVTDFEYDKLNRQTKTIMPLLTEQTVRGTIVNEYFKEADPKTNLMSVTDAEENTTSFEYNGRYLRANQTNALDDTFVWEYDDASNLSKAIDEENNVTRHEYDGQNRQTFVYRTMTDVDDSREIATEIKYDAAGNQRFVIDAKGSSTETIYDEWNRPYQVDDPEQYLTTMIRDGEGREVEVTDGNGHKRSFERDARGLVLTATDAEGFDTLYTYDHNDNVKTVTNALGYVTHTDYDDADRKLLTSEAVGTSEKRTSGVLEYDKVGNALKVRDGNGNIIVTKYNALNLPWEQYDPAPFKSQFVTTLYDRNGKPTSVTNRLGRTTTFTYDPLGRVDTVTDPSPFHLQTIVTRYDKVSNVRTVKDKRGIIAETIYDSLYRPLEQQRAGVRILSNEYDDVGNLTATIDAENNRTEYLYTLRNLLEVTTFIDGTNDYTEERSYDGVGNLLTVTDEESDVTTYTYDNENRQKTAEFADETSENDYDKVGNLLKVTKPEGNDRSMTYDGLNRLETVTDGGLLTTTYSYDDNDNLLTQLDPRGHLVEFTFDTLNRKTQHIQKKASGNLIVTYDTYDAEGNLKQSTDAKGQIFSYEYDELNRPTKTIYPQLTTPFLAIRDVTTGYDANNNVTTIDELKKIAGSGSMTDSTVNIYDNFDRLKRSTQRDMSITYDYDNNGNRTSVATAARSTSYRYDARNRLATVVADGTTRYSYTPDSKKSTVVYPNGTGMVYTYTAADRIDTIINSSGAAIISSYDYDYDHNGNRIRQEEIQTALGTGTESEPVPLVTTYRYDDLDRMDQFILTHGTETTINSYSFDGYNRKTEDVSIQGVRTIAKVYACDETNWLTELVDSVNDSTITYQYDANGNTTTKTMTGPGSETAIGTGSGAEPDTEVPVPVFVPVVTSFTYDAANRMVETTQDATSLGRYDYNASGMRVRHYGSERGDVEYFYDGGSVLEEFVAGASGSLLAHYRYGDRLLSLDAPDDGGLQYYHHDGLGSTVNLTDSVGATKVSYQLDPWGHIRNQIGSSVNRQVFTGQEHDEKTGLIYFGARYYDPDIARFMSQDSYLGEAGTPPSLHRYLYAYGNPTVYVDLMGYATVNYLPEYNYDRDIQENDVTSGIDILNIEFDNAPDLVDGLKEVANDGIEITIEAYNGVPIKDGLLGVTWPVRQAAYWSAFKWLGGNYRNGDYEPKNIMPYNEFNLESNEDLVAITGILSDEESLRGFLQNRIEERNVRSGFGVLNPSTKDDPVQSWLGKLGWGGVVANIAIAGFRDVIETVGQKLYLPDITAEFTAKSIDEYIEMHPERNLSSIHLHSQGGATGTTLSAMYLSEDIKAKMDYFTYGSASNPVFGWKSQRHRMNILDPVSHAAGRGLVFAPVALIDAFRPNVIQDWNMNTENGAGHSWSTSYGQSPAR